MQQCRVELASKSAATKGQPGKWNPSSTSISSVTLHVSLHPLEPGFLIPAVGSDAA